MDITCGKLATVGVDSTSETLTPASVDSTSETLSLARLDNTTDTLTLAMLDRETQGPWEFEYSYGGEADLHQHSHRCKKNPGHKNFIPVDKFSIEDLPEDYQDRNVVDFIQAVSDLTVRVSVKYVSDKRPGTAVNVRNRRKMTCGTGLISYVNMSLDNNCWMQSNCKCRDCRNSSTPETNFAIISINTAAHVVFDDLGVEHTTCHLFFDKGDSLDTCTGVVTLTDMSLVYSHVRSDTCHMEHYTHDLDLAQRLRQTMKKMDQQTGKFYREMPRSEQFKESRQVLGPQPLLVVVVSHPHGCSKQISLGRSTGTNVFNNCPVSLLYNTATCPGSSGAHVCVLQEFYGTWMKDGRNIVDRPHCGGYDVNRGINYCHETAGIQLLDIVSLEMLQRNQGAWGDNFCCVEEEDQNQHYAACKKNPGHGNFFPVEKFSMDNLPPFYRSGDVMRLLKLVSDRTVRVSVKYVSEKRPETVPGTDIPYPWFSSRGSNLTRVGTGFIDSVVALGKDDCSCKECRNSPKPKRLSYIEIRTATHLVYDKLEAEHSTCHLFFDSGETLDGCSNDVTLTDVYAVYEVLERDTYLIKYFTHNVDLVRRLQKMNDQYDLAFESLRRSTDFKRKNKVKQNGGEETTQEPPILITVSHPHGRAKQVSICCCGNPGNADTEESQCSHTSMLCPGSSGAPVIELSINISIL